MDELRNLTNRSFYNLLNKSDEELEQWLIDKRLLPDDSCTCECGGTMNKRNRGAKGVTYRCTSKNCRKEKKRFFKDDPFFHFWSQVQQKYNFGE